MQSLAIKYRPKMWDDVVEQDSVKVILTQQLKSDEIKNAYLFVGGAGTGKTTCARIFAKEINKGQGNPIEMDAASNNSVDDVRDIIQQAKTKALNAEYKIFIIDECHALSNNAWQAMLKLIEEPPAKSIFIFCTTDPQKIPKTILSRVQRYDFQRISQQGIVLRLTEILAKEEIPQLEDGLEAIEYIAKIADGGMRDAITLMDKCLAYSKDLTLENVIKALGVADYTRMIKLTDAVFERNKENVIQYIEDIHSHGIDLKQFIRQYLEFILDLNKFLITGSYDYIKIPKTYANWLSSLDDAEFNMLQHFLDSLIKLNTEIKWDNNPKVLIEAMLLKETIE